MNPMSTIAATTPIQLVLDPARRRLLRAALAAVAAMGVAPLALAAAGANEIGGVRFETRLQLGGQSLQLNGVGMRAVAWFKGYAAGLYLPRRAATPEELAGQDGPKRLQMRMLVDVPVEEFIKAFHKGIGRNTPQDQQAGLAERMERFDQLVKPLVKVKTGDTINLDYLPEQGMVMSHNGRKVGAAIPGADFYVALMGVFIGPKPVDDKLKRGLLGGAG